MKNIILIRHSKSSWEIDLPDKERPLMSKGVDDAILVATYGLKMLPKNYTVFASTAKRANETAIQFSNTFGYPTEKIIFDDNLYTFEVYYLHKFIKSISNTIDNVILFGHNEAITDFVNKFGTIFIDNVPTSGLVHMEFKTDSWENLSNGKTITTLFPRNLKK